MSQAKRALVTGITGFVGSHLVEHLLRVEHWHIVGMIRWRSPLDNLREVIRSPRLSFVYADLRDSIAVDAAVREAKPDYVFHLAAQSFPRTSFDSPLDTIDTNTQGTLRLLESMRRHAPEAWIHVCSSSEVYGRVPKEFVPINEDCRFHPASPYAISKVGADLTAQHYAQAYGMNIIVTRMFTHTGPRRGDVFAESSFAKQIAMIEAGLIEPKIYHGNLDSLRTIADVRDAVRAYHMALTVRPQRGAVYNIGGSTTLTVGEILSWLVTEAHLPLATLHQDPARMRPLDADLQVPDCTRFRGHTGWAPEIPFEVTMRDLLGYWRERVRSGAAVIQR